MRNLAYLTFLIFVSYFFSSAITYLFKLNNILKSLFFDPSIVDSIS